MKEQFSQTATIILAGGTSSRMGGDRNKLLLPLDDRPVLLHVIEAALASRAQPVLLVLGHQTEEVRAQLRAFLPEGTIEIVENPDYRQGMSTTLQTGLHALLTKDYKKDLTGVIFLLGDQPMINARIIDSLLACREQTQKRIILPLYQGQRGNPVIFSLDFANELMQIRGDEGGRSVLKNHPDDIATLEIGKLAANFDVDTWEAYLKVQAAWQKQTQEERS